MTTRSSIQRATRDERETDKMDGAQRPVTSVESPTALSLYWEGLPTVRQPGARSRPSARDLHTPLRRAQTSTARRIAYSVLTESAKFAFGLKPVVPGVTVLAAALLVKLVGAPGDLFLTVAR